MAKTQPVSHVCADIAQNELHSILAGANAGRRTPSPLPVQSASLGEIYVAP